MVGRRSASLDFFDQVFVARPFSQEKYRSSECAASFPSVRYNPDDISLQEAEYHRLQHQFPSTPERGNLNRAEAPRLRKGIRLMLLLPDKKLGNYKTGADKERKYQKELRSGDAL
jgi:hypothetical protein